MTKTTSTLQPMEHTAKQAVHFIEPELLNPPNPLVINVIGTGGTGSRVLWELADLNQIFTTLGHPGFFVRAFDSKTVAPHNRGRQRFAQAEEGANKAEILINRINRFYGSYWQGFSHHYGLDYLDRVAALPAQITISCVDKVRPRFEIAQILKTQAAAIEKSDDIKPTYWIDFGNGQFTGQVILSTLRTIKQPESQKYVPVPTLPMITEEYKATLEAVNDRNEPSCSMEEALRSQDISINPTLAVLGCRLFVQLFRDGLTRHRGLFVNLQDFKMVPIPITCPDQTGIQA